MTQLLQNAAYGTVLILVAALLRRVLGDRLAPEARLALWAVCLFRLLTPAAPESVLSLWGLLPRLFQATVSAAADPPTPKLYVLPQDIPAPEPSISWEAAPFALWLAVGAALVVWYILSWRRTRRAVACAIPLNRSDGRYAALPKCAHLREGPMEGAPLTFGALRPTVVLSPGLAGTELECVLAHEGVHASRRDNLWHYAMALATTVHWWNPAVWFMSRLLRRDIELSCDRAALRKLGTDRRAEYACALVSLATQTEGPAFCQTFGRKAAEERIRSIMKFKKNSVIGAIFTLALVLTVTAAFASEPQKPSDEYDSVQSGKLLSVTAVKDGIVGKVVAAGEINYDDAPAVSYKILSSDYEVVAEGEMSYDGAPAVIRKVLLPDYVGEEEESGFSFCSYSVKDAETAEDIVVRLVGADGDSRPVISLFPICDDVDCNIADPHVHMNGQVLDVEYENPYDGVEAGIVVAEPDSAAP